MPDSFDAELAVNSRPRSVLTTDNPGAESPNVHPVDAVLADPGSVVAVYQPIVDLATSRVVGYEALARWPHIHGVEPGMLFRAAAERGALRDLDWACRLAALQGALDARLPDSCAVFVNVEADSGPFVPAYARRLVDLAKAELDVVIELTERSLQGDPTVVLALVRAVRDAGGVIALDDVGATPDSLALLEFIAPEVIKLDRSLVQCDPSRTHADTIAAIAATVESTGAVVVAEGIETPEHRERARALGATLGQGWHFGYPGSLPRRIPGRHGTLENASARHRFAGPVGERPTPALPSDLFAMTSPKVGRKDLVLALTRQIEEQAGELRQPLTVLSAFQDRQWFSPRVAEHYGKLAADNPFVAVVGVGMPVEPAPGVRGAALDPAEPFASQWVITVVGRHYTAAVIARDLGDGGRDADRRFEFVHTFDRTMVLLAARSVLNRVVCV